MDSITLGMERNVASNRYHANVHGNVRSIAEGDHSVFAFRAIGDRLDMKQSIVELEGAAAYSMECWVYADRYTHGTIAGLYQTAELNDEMLSASLMEILGVSNSNFAGRRLRFLHRNPPGVEGGTDTISENDYNLGQWMHLATVKSRGALKIYVDGEIAGSAEDESSLPQSGLLLRIGMLSPPPDAPERYRQFQGRLDELAIYGRALTESEIKQRVNRGRELLGY